MAPLGNLTFSYLRLRPLPCRRLRPILAYFPFPSSSPSTHFPKPRGRYGRDFKIDFGRHKGCRLGTLPPSYLKWLSKQVDPFFSSWSKLAKEVLKDPVYQDRIEWEPANRLFFGDLKSNFIYDESFDMIKAYRNIGETYGWDMDDEEGWSKVNLELIGTSYSGRIPRKKKERFQLGASEIVKKEEIEKSEKIEKRNEPLVGGKRGERIERMRLRREKVPVRIEEIGEGNKGEELGNLDSQNCVKQIKMSGFPVGRKRGERIHMMKFRAERNVQMEKSDKAEGKILEAKEEEEEAPRITIKKESTSRRKRGLLKEKRELGVGRNDGMLSFAKRVGSSGNAEIFNPFPGREALFEKIRSRND